MLENESCTTLSTYKNFSSLSHLLPVSNDDSDLLGGLEDDGLRGHEVGDLQAGALRRLVVAERNILLAWI